MISGTNFCYRRRPSAYNCKLDFLSNQRILHGEAISAYPHENRHIYFVSTANPIGKKWAWMEINVKLLTTIYVRLEVFTEVTMKNAAFRDVALCGFITNQRSGGTCRLHLQGRINNACGENC
jgi:hypothetical protein